ncbi:hypothetical protein [Methanobacterium sp. ACI-7]|uniref:hypothetical protein n=1 Tax=unclassified Methanobacterium TaxID=2627676 RepID=UPI0039C231B2
MNNENIEFEELEEPKVEEAVEILRKYFKTSYEAAGLEWTDKNDTEIRFAILEIINTPLYEIQRAILEADDSCSCDEDNDPSCNCNEE